ncbi:Acyl-coenzyme A oxidase [Zea mays]|uniref:Acyl-coenzyme A oxidase n=1 Tax=Zea mays TaxID=4577 RepID=A0A1D6PR01_MAIZE|nr:Acyl-coenzyme A oxidase [Zea mays]
MATGSAAGEESSAAARRLRRLSLHLLQPAPAPADRHQQPLALAACARRVEGGADVAAALAAYLRGRHRAAQMRLFDFFRARPDLQTPVELPTAAHRELCYRQLRALVREAGVRPLTLMATDPAEYFAVMEAAGGADISLGVKLGVQYSLWGGSVINLGTKKHRDKYFDGIDNLDYPGCFAMTELHHGSNVQALQTTATFDPVTDEFIINTPNDGAIKWWIGNAALHGKFATVFARLILPLQGKGGEAADMGIHAFIVPIRDLETHAVLPGIEINDCGHKIGLNGVDNGALRFRSVRIPRDNLLNRFGDVSRDGKYTSSLPTINKRFAATLGELVGGRVGIAYCSVGVLKVAVTIAVRYALLRHQFGPPKQPEISVLDYQSHQHKLMPMLASSYAFHFATVQLVDKYSEMKKTNDEDLIADVHVLSSGLKAYITSYTAKSISVCREACGGHGYAAVNRFGALRNDHDIFQTFEGDNTVLLQQKHSKTLGGFGAWNRCLNHLLTLAESHIESVILAKFIESVKSCPDEKSREVLKLVCDLYALDRIWQDIGTYRNVDYVAPNKAKAIHKLTDYLSYQVRLVARELVDAFDLPDLIIRAPIGMQSEAYAQYTQYVGF